MKLTIGQTAKAVGLSKTTIAKHLENGKISGDWNHSTNPPQREIDASEIMRVYGVDVNLPPSKRQQVTPQNTGEFNPLQALLEAKEEQIKTLKGQVQTLEEQLDRKDTQIGQLQTLLAAPKEPPADRLAEIEAKLKATLERFEAEEAAERAKEPPAAVPAPTSSQAAPSLWARLWRRS